MNFKDTINWAIIDAPVPESFFGDHAARANMVRHGVKNGVITQSRVLAELKEQDETKELTPSSKYKANVKQKIKWIEEFFFPKCKKELQWFEDMFGEDITRTMDAARAIMAKQPVNVMSNDAAASAKKQLGTYPPGIADMRGED